MATLVLAEKPSVARDVARVIGARERGNGFLKGSGYIVTWAVGHLVTLKEPDELDEKYKKWRREDLPILPVRMETKVIPKTRDQYKIIKGLLDDDEVTDVICATDSGREGELIRIHAQCFSKRVTGIPNTVVLFKFRVPGGAEMHFQ